MKTLGKMTLPAALVLAAFLLPPLLNAQGGPGSGWRVMRYDPATETTVTGTVEHVKTVPARRAGHGIHLLLKTSATTLDVHLGPKAFLKEKGFSVDKGDQVEVTGSKVTLKSGEALIARKIKKGDTTLILRNEQGVPMWSRSRRR